MKTFLTHIDENALGPSIGQFYPVADLNAQKMVLGPNKAVGTQRELKKSDLDQLEKYADRLFASVGIDVEFTRHFLDRVNDLRNTRQIT